MCLHLKIRFSFASQPRKVIAFIGQYNNIFNCRLRYTAPLMLSVMICLCLSVCWINKSSSNTELLYFSAYLQLSQCEAEQKNEIFTDIDRWFLIHRAKSHKSQIVLAKINHNQTDGDMQSANYHREFIVAECTIQ